MKLLVLTQGIFPLAWDEQARRCRTLVEQLAGHALAEVTVAHPHAPGVFPAGKGIAELTVPGGVPGDGAAARRHFGNRATPLIQRAEADAVLAFGTVTHGFDESLWRKTILHAGDPGPDLHARWWKRIGQAAGRKLLIEAMRSCHALVSTGGRTTEWLRELWPDGGNRLRVIPDGVELPLGPGADARTVTGPPPSTGGALELLLPAPLAPEAVEFVIALAQRLALEGQEDLVRFRLAWEPGAPAMDLPGKFPPNMDVAGALDPASWRARMAACHAVLLPGPRHAAQTALQVMAQAKPLFAADAGAAKELVSMHNGYLLPALDAEAWRDAVLAFCERKPDTRRKMGLYALERAKELFSWPVVLPQWDALLRTVATATPH